MQIHYLFLYFAILLEVVGSVMLKLSNGFENLLATVGVFIFYAGSYYFFSKSLKTISLSTGYVIWSGVGIVANTLIGMIFWNDYITDINFMGMVLVIGGLYFLNTDSKASQGT